MPTHSRAAGAAGEWHPHRFALATVDLAVTEDAAGDAGDVRPVLAMGAGPVAVDERCDDQVAVGDPVYVGADILDDADELVADRADSM